MRHLGKVALVTGAARGIGLAISSRLIAEGASVMMSDVLSDIGRAASARLSLQGNSEFVAADLLKKEDISQVVRATRDRFGRIDILVCNAGIATATPFLDVSEEEYDRTMSINVKSVFLLCQTVAKQMVQNEDHGNYKKGAIVLMSSTGALLGSEDKVPYVTSKGAISSMMRGMAIALGPRGIRVNAVGPGATMTDMARDHLLDDQSSLEMVLSRTPLGRLAEPHEVAACVAFLTSDDATYMNGQTLYVDGGKLALNYVIRNSAAPVTGGIL